MKVLMILTLLLIGCSLARPQYVMMVKPDTGERVTCQQPVYSPNNPGQQIFLPVIFPDLDVVQQCVKQHERLGFQQANPAP